MSSFGYIWIAIALVLVAAGIRVNGVVARSVQQRAEFREGVMIAGLALTVVAGALVGFGIFRTRRTVRGQASSDAIADRSSSSASRPS